MSPCINAFIRLFWYARQATPARSHSCDRVTVDDRMTGQGDTGPRLTHATLQRGYIWVALAMALWAGFPIGAHLAAVLGFGFPVGRGFGSFVQLHGHVQLVGWTGLFIMGISLYFLPRLAGVPLAQPRWPVWILWLMAVGLGLRSIGQVVVPYLVYSPWLAPVVWLVAGSGLLEWVGVGLYTILLLRTVRGVGDSQRPALLAVRPYVGMMLAGWVLYACLNLGLLGHMALQRSVVVHQAWYQFAVQSFIGLVLLPVAWAFSIRTLPLYLGLALPGWPVRGMAFVYLAALILQVLPTAPPLAELAPRVMSDLTSLGTLLKGSVILWFVWQLDVLTRHREPRPLHGQRHQEPARRLAPAPHGAFGRFERLVYAAYVWLVLAACGEVISGAAVLLGRSRLGMGNTVRHMYLLGFSTMLIFGMAVRMLPGFFQQRRVARPALVNATFWLGNAATVCRVLLFVLPPVILQGVPAGIEMARSAFAVSGLLGLAAVWCLAANVWQTATQVQHSHGSRAH
jgi:uncharacterized protein involved in response to NO